MMRDLLTEHTWLQSATPILLDAALKGVILFVVAAIGVYLLRKRSAASRHAVWTAAVIGHLAIPVFAVLLPAWRLPILPPANWMQPSAPTQAAAAASPIEDARLPEGDRATPGASAPTVGVRGPGIGAPVPGEPGPGVEAARGSLLPRGTEASAGTRARSSPLVLLAGIWMVGALLVLLRLAIGTWRVGQLARDGARVEDGMWLSLTQRLANRLGVSRPLTLLRGDSLAVPVTWGIVYPAVLLPQDADTWPEERRRFVLVHEMAHVKRFDALTQLLAQISVALFWFDPLVWVAAHRMRVEREHACDDYVLRDGTAPSLYAGELLEMVRSIGTPRHDRAAPAFAALAMARRSEFEGRMLAILDPGLNRQTLNRRGTLMTGVIVALLTLPLAALRPFGQPGGEAIAAELPASFKVSITPASPAATPPADVGAAAAAVEAPPVESQSTSATVVSSTGDASCERYLAASMKGSSVHVATGSQNRREKLNFVHAADGLCAEAHVLGAVSFSPDERQITYIEPGGFARFREVGRGRDRSVSVLPGGNGSLSYSAALNGGATPFDAEMQAWLARFLPQVLREAGINVPARVARLRASGGVAAVLEEIGEIRSTGSKRTHYEELLKSAPLNPTDASKVISQVGPDLGASSGDLSSVLQKMPRTVVRSSLARPALADAIARINSSGDMTNTLEALATNADSETLLMLAKAAEGIPSNGDKANFLISTAAEYLTPNDENLRSAYFRTAATVASDGDLSNILISSMRHGPTNPGVVTHVIRTSEELRSDGDISNVLISLANQRLLTGRPAAIQGVIQRTMSMRSSGDRANVLIVLARHSLVSTPALKDSYLRAADAIPSSGDRANVLAVLARQ